ncbi:hypothetical protein M422DRAFT_83866, partial [Sphaerobolus stellatus SS14]
SSNDVGRVFLQSMISRRVISDKLAKTLWKKSIEAVQAADESLEVPYNANEFDQYIHDLNRKLEQIDFKLIFTVDEVVGQKVLVLVNARSDELAQLATEYTPAEIAYFRALVEQIILASSESYSISSMTALREVSNLKSSMTKGQAEVVLSNFVANGWLLKSPRGRFSLSTRTLVELQTYLKNNYEENLNECTVCFEFVTKGVGCYTVNCAARLHNHCFATLTQSNNTRACPSCKVSWADTRKLISVGEGALGEGEDSRTTRKRRAASEDDDEESAEGSEEEEEEEEQEQEQEEEPSQPKTKKGAKAKGK